MAESGPQQEVKLKKLPSRKALVPFVSVESMMHLVHYIGLETVLKELTDVIEADFRRWEVFDETRGWPAIPAKA